MDTVGIDERQFLDLVGKAMDAAVDETRWAEFLQAMATSVSAIGALFTGCSFSDPARGFLYVAGLDASMARLFVQRYQDNMLSRAMRIQPLGHAVDQFSLVNRRALEATEFYWNVLQPQNNHALPSVGLPLGVGFDTGGIAIALDGRSDEAPRRAIALLNALAPLLRRAIVANLHLRAAAAIAQGFAAAIESLPSALILLARDSQVIFANQNATRIVSQSDGLSIVAGTLAAARPADSRALQRLVHAAGQTGDGAAVRSWGTVALARPSGKAPLMVLVTPVRGLQDLCVLPLHRSPC